MTRRPDAAARAGASSDWKTVVWRSGVDQWRRSEARKQPQFFQGRHTITARVRVLFFFFHNDLGAVRIVHVGFSEKTRRNTRSHGPSSEEGVVFGGGFVSTSLPAHRTGDGVRADDASNRDEVTPNSTERPERARNEHLTSIDM